VVTVAAGSERAGPADAPPGDGRDTPEAEGCVPPHPAANRLSAVAAITTVTARARLRTRPDTV
jgi:hypothetical protein